MRVSEEQVSHPDRTFRFLRFETDRFRGDRHRHRQLELTWIEAGVGLRFVGDDAARLRPATSCCSAPTSRTPG